MVNPEQKSAPRPTMLCILDGWGIRAEKEGNATVLAHTPNLDRLFASCPHSQLDASGLAVGLPEGQMGNSEVGHMNIGAGRVIYQDMTRISKSIADGDFFTNPVLIQVMHQVKAAGSTLHLLGLLSDGGVHSLNTHLYALMKMAQQQGAKQLRIHPILDGRDTPPRSAAIYLQQLQDQINALGCGKIATISGRFYTMDRDRRWDRVERAYSCLTESKGIHYPDAATAIEAAYSSGTSDEFVEPCVIGAIDTTTRICSGDGVIMFNYRSDRAREITHALTDPSFDGFARSSVPELSGYVCLTEYEKSLNLPVAFPPEEYPDILAEVVANAGLRQLRIAETEKYAHVTFFFNGGRDEPFTGEERVLIPSPQDVPTYDLKPEMSADAVAHCVVKKIQAACPDLIILNFANPDMVGHTGNLDAAIKAMECVDRCCGMVCDAFVGAGGHMLITADHGNCEQMKAPDGGPFTAHTSNPVPLIYVSSDTPVHTELEHGILADIAPTLLYMLELGQPTAMTGHNLLHRS
ncbi:MAG: 2,3-bisphosphoglycerate-independent phosphoglycerate mutase [Desulfuromonadaceae bacterium]|nr:2,3-bisphosphoglycerate-independent phosphoglycerate mutase [Desulfuromonadaceae bacterium]